MKYGSFSQDGTEYIINNPLTPRPWINYLTNEKYCAIISQCAGGYSFYKDCRSDRIHRWAPENWHTDRPGRYLYIRDEESSKYWSAAFQPIRAPYSQYEARHGLGYTKIHLVCNEIETESTFFVHSTDPIEFCSVRLKNTSSRSRKLKLYPYMELLIGDYHMELLYRNIMNLYDRVWFDADTNAILANKTAAWGDMNIKPFPYTLYFASSLPVQGYATRKDGFLGRYNTEENPQVVKEGSEIKNGFSSGEDSIAAFKHEVSLEPGEEINFTLFLGVGKDKAEIKKSIAKYQSHATVMAELKTVQDIWRKRIIDNVWIQTPDHDFDTVMNIWVKYQAYICNFWSRSPSYYHEGSGGRGYRDSCQDSEGILAINQEMARTKMLTIAKLIRADGTSAPGWSDTTGPASHRPNKDHQVWLTYTIAAYIKETGDKSILMEKVPFLKDQWIKGWWVDKEWKKGSYYEGKTTVYDKLCRNLNFTYSDTGAHGLCRIGHADWNDAIDAAGIKHKGESVMISMQLVRSLKILAELSELIGKKKEAKEFRKRAQTMTKRIETVCWDGEWYKRGFTDDGTVYGSKKCKEGKIFINTQNWAVLAGIPEGKRLETVLNSVDKHLDGDHGYALFYPAYSKWDPKLGRISMFSEGTKENAAVFCHAATFMVVANLISGRGTRGYEGLKKIMPNAQKDYEVYKTEPYVYSEYMIGPEHPYLYGEGAFTWITGTAAWNFLAASEYLLGARRDYEGLRICPSVPSYWKNASIRRPFRGDVYEITIENPDGVESGVKELYLDGVLQEGDLIRPVKDGKTHKVRVVLGKLTGPASEKSGTASGNGHKKVTAGSTDGKVLQRV